MTASFLPCDQPLPRLKRLPRAGTSVSTRLGELVWSHVPIHRRGAEASPVTARELAQVVAATERTIGVALRQLDLEGMVFVRPRLTGRKGRPPLEYWRVA